MMKFTKTSIPKGVVVVQILSFIVYVAFLSTIEHHAHIPAEFIVLVMFLVWSVIIVLIFSFIYFKFRENKKIWSIPFYIFFVLGVLSVFIDWASIV